MKEPIIDKHEIAKLLDSEITDEIINKYFWYSDGTRIVRSFKTLPSNIAHYLDNRYPDSESYQETIIRIYLGKYETRPTCPICGKVLPYLGYSLKRGVFPRGCSISCSSIISGKEYKEEHGHHKVFKAQEIRRRKRDELGIPYQNVEKWKNTMMEKYGTTALLEIPGMKEHIIKSNIEKYGTEWYFQSEECKDKMIEKFGVENYWKTEEAAKQTSKRMKGNKEIQAKREETMMNKYGVTTPFHTDEYYQI